MVNFEIPMQYRPGPKQREWLFFATGVVASLLSIICGPTIYPVMAESFQIFATVPANATQFQLAIEQPSAIRVPQNTTIDMSLLYGSYLPSQTDTIVIEVSWSLGTKVSNEATVPIVAFVPNSASAAYGGAAPTVNTAARTITWQINPMPPGTNRRVSWQLQSLNFTEDTDVNFLVNARLIGSGFEKTTTPITLSYRYNTPTVTPETTPNATVSPIPSVTTTISPTPLVTTSPTPVKQLPTPTPRNILAPIINQIDNIPIVGPPVKQGLDKAEEVAQRDGAIIAAPLPAFALIPALLNLIPLLGYAPWWQIPSLLGAMFWSKRRRPWGVVYDAVTKEPLDPAYIVLTDENGKSYQAISDIYGRYQFLVDPGKYKLDVKKSNYVFPAASLKQESTDGLYEDLYYGGEIIVEDNAAINYNIPLDPVAVDWNQQKKEAMGIKRSGSKLLRAISWIFWGGYVWSLLMAILAVTMINLIVLVFYTGLVGLRLVNKWRSPWGVVYGPDNKPVVSAAVSIIDLNNPQVKRPPVVTKDGGRYAFLVDKGVYQLQVAVKKPYGYGAPVSGPIVTVVGKEGTINKDLVVEINDLNTDNSGVTLSGLEQANPNSNPSKVP